MVDLISPDRTLTKNAIKTFILRVDLIKNDSLEITKFANELSPFFDRLEKRQFTNFTFTLTQGRSEINHAREVFDYVLISESRSLSMTLSEQNNAFWIECNHYVDKTTYQYFITKAREVLVKLSPDVIARRIGLRFINEFRCNKASKIQSIYGKRLSAITKSMLFGDSQSRIIGVEEYNIGEQKIRVQYGVPNTLYPSIITIYDLLFDIDSFIDRSCTLAEWDEIIDNLNHSAYDKFILEMNPSYVQGLM